MSRILPVLIIVGSMPSCARIIVHDEQAAARAAAQFAQVAFVDRDSPKAHGLLAASVAPQISIEKLSETVAKMHPKSFPARVTATEFEPMPGRRGMTIYLKGTGDGEEFYYRLVMEGDAASGYWVGGLFRGNGTYPTSNRRPLR